MLIYEYIAFAVIVLILVQNNHVSIIKLTYHKISSDKTQNHNLPGRQIVVCENYSFLQIHSCISF